MKCTNCGSDLPENSSFCPTCGQPAVQQAAPYSSPVPMDEKTFYNTYASKKAKNWVTALIVICFITAAVSVLSLLVSVLAVVDIAFYLVMGIMLLKKKSWGIALAVVIYCGLAIVINLILSGTMTGILALIIGIFAVVKLKKVHAAYEQYKTTGLPPMNFIG